MLFMNRHQQNTAIAGGGIQIAPAKPRLKKPPLYRVIILNDDYTPMDFVVRILKTFFRMETHRATELMLRIHSTGAGICGVFPREIAETRVSQVNGYSRSQQHPLTCTMEPVE